MHDAMNSREGKTYVFFIPPGWLLGGTVVAETETMFILKDAVYLEASGADVTLIGDVPMAETPKELNHAAQTVWPVPDGMEISKEACLIRVPCMRDLKPLNRRREGKKLKNA